MDLTVSVPEFTHVFTSTAVVFCLCLFLHVHLHFFFFFVVLHSTKQLISIPYLSLSDLNNKTSELH